MAQTKNEYIQQIVKLELLICEHGGKLDAIKSEMIKEYCPFQRKDNVSYNFRGKIRFGTIVFIKVNSVMQFYAIIKPLNKDFTPFARRLDMHKIMITEIIKKY